MWEKRRSCHLSSLLFSGMTIDTEINLSLQQQYFSPFAALFVDLACSHSFDVLSINELVDVPFPMHAQWNSSEQQNLETSKDKKSVQISVFLKKIDTAIGVVSPCLKLFWENLTEQCFGMILFRYPRSYGKIVSENHSFEDFSSHNNIHIHGCSTKTDIRLKPPNSESNL